MFVVLRNRETMTSYLVLVVVNGGNDDDDDDDDDHDDFIKTMTKMMML